MRGGRGLSTQRWWTSVDGVMRAWSGRDLTGEWPHPLAEELIKYMDEARVDVCFCLREGMGHVSGHTVQFSTNQFMIDQNPAIDGALFPDRFDHRLPSARPRNQQTPEP